MNQAEEDAIVGKLFREHKEVTSRLAKLQVKAADVGRGLVHIGELLMQVPSCIVAQGENYKAETLGRAEPYKLNLEDLSADSVLQVAREIRECMNTLNDLDRQKLRLEMSGKW